ncbi:MAG: hypothetical protein SGI98_13185 [Verrucomicrobiota bacterium]|nr:hypothetical protein [Verrucomicrobiota bacterium]
MKTLDIGDADYHSVKEYLDDAKSPQGKVIMVTGKGKIILQDTPEAIALMTEIITEASKPAPLIRIELTLDEKGSSSVKGVDVQASGSINTGRGNIKINPIENNMLSMSARNDSSKSSHLSSQFLLVKSGASAVIKVGEDVPFVDYFWAYAHELGILYDVNVRWQEIGTQMRVYASARGNMIDIEIVPEITALTGDRYAPVSFRSLATTVTLRNGESMNIGGFSKADNDFNRHFFFGTRATGTLTGTFRLKAQLQ